MAAMTRAQYVGIGALLAALLVLAPLAGLALLDLVAHGFTQL